MHFSSIFHPIGQGCFYRADLSKNSKHFHFVYDCGSNSHAKFLSHEIKKAADFLCKNGRLNLLIISHFDADHVNGVFELLHQLPECDTVILPYLTPLERLEILAADKDEQGDGGPGDDGTGLSEQNNNLWIGFLRNPVLMLREFKVKKVIYVHGDENGEGGNNDDFPREPDAPEESDKEDSLELINNLKKIAPPENDNQNGDSYISVEHCQHHGYVSIDQLWYFRFYNEKKKEEKVTAFHEAMKGMLEKNKNDFAQLFNEDNRKEIADLYKYHLGNINHTSLSVFHAPVQRSHYKITRFMPMRDDSGYYYRDNDSPAGTLLTGDSSLKQKNRLDNFTNHYKEELDNVYIFQVPHHGAIHNWNGEIISKMESACHFVINAGNDRKLHPHEHVLKDLLSRVRSGIILNSEKQPVCNYFNFFKE